MIQSLVVGVGLCAALFILSIVIAVVQIRRWMRNFVKGF